VCWLLNNDQRVPFPLWEEYVTASKDVCSYRRLVNSLLSALYTLLGHISLLASEETEESDR
jgi:hypothetical protein